MRNKIIDVMGSLLTVLLTFLATPAILLTAVGNPLDSALGQQWSQGARDLLAVVVLVAWVAWFACCTQLARAVIEQVRQGHVSAPAGAVLTEQIASRIAAGVLTLMALVAPFALTSGAGASSGRGEVSTAILDAPTQSAATVAVVALTPPADLVYVVREGDTLWSIAAAQLGDDHDWPAIAALNLGRTMPDGLRFVDPNRIYAGWSLQMPALGAPAAPHAGSTTTDAEQPSIALATPLEAATFSQGTLKRQPVPVSLHQSESVPTERARPLGGAGGDDSNLPELAALGVGAIACGALTRRARRMRLLRQVSTNEPDFASTLSEDAIDTDVLLARFAGVPALRAFEAANCALAQAIGQAERTESAVRFRAVCVGAAGIDFWLAEPKRPAPDGFVLSSDGKAWHTAHGAIGPNDLVRPWLPIVLPVGEDEAGTWLIPLVPGSCLPFVGEAAGDLWRAARAVQEAWSWADMILITEDPDLVADEVRLGNFPGGSAEDSQQVLFFGDPTLLSDALAERVSVVTVSHVSASDVTIVVDRRAASIHPLGRTVRPHLMNASTSSLVGELMAPPSTDGLTRTLSHLSDGSHPSGQRAFFGRRNPEAAALFEGDATPDVATAASAGTVEVKLLTANPRLEGLDNALPPNRARRAVELVAYLALQQGKEVTSDRLRPRVLGSSDADAASKTLFNIAAAARRALGTDAAGMPLLPMGSRTGHYRVSEAVTIDVHRAAHLAAAGNAAEDPQVAMALLREALTLIEGEPLANALAGYTWWEAEGHGARIAAVLVNAASNLAALAVNEELFELAQWGLDRARLVDPYSEALSRAAMQVAAAAGDTDRLRREWRECQHRIDELDPGSTPSPRTERLYGQLAQEILISGRANPQ